MEPSWKRESHKSGGIFLNTFNYEALKYWVGVPQGQSYNEEKMLH